MFNSLGIQVDLGVHSMKCTAAGGASLRLNLLFNQLQGGYSSASMIDTHTLFNACFSGSIAQSIGESSRVTYSMNWTIPSHLPYFDGHFPGQPVFPAVGIVDASLYLLRQTRPESNFSITQVKTAKFLQLMGPGAEVGIEWIQEGTSTWSFQWRGLKSKDVFASIKIQV